LKPTTTLATARTTDGAELVLVERDKHYYLSVNRQPLMGTNASESEKVLAQLACEGLLCRPSARVLIGGLGFGFTLRRTLELVGPSANVVVAELLNEVVTWNRQFLADINGSLLDDPRVEIKVADVYKLITDSPGDYFDAIQLDVDNGPIAMVQDGNARLYQAQGFAAIHRALKPKGRVTFWSAGQDPLFVKRLGKAGFNVHSVAAKAYPQAKRCTHTIFVADKR
jgi:spermidine synthase